MMNFPKNLQYLKDKLREKRNIIIVALIIVAVLLLLVIGLWMQRNSASRRDVAQEQHHPPEQVSLTIGEQSIEGQKQPAKKVTVSYFLKPSADEVLAKTKELGEAELPAPNQKYAGLRVMWPVYFFQVLKQEGNRATVLLDVSEDGFGATIITDIDTARFPEIGTTERGAKIWLAGEIMGVDPSGTGTIRIVTEEVRFQEKLEEAVRGTGKGGPEAEPAHVVPESSTKAEEGTH